MTYVSAKQLRKVFNKTKKGRALGEAGGNRMYMLFGGLKNFLGCLSSAVITTP